MDLDGLKSRCKLTASGCWEWQGATASGYGRVKVWRKVVSAHRLAFQLANPDVDVKGFDVCHKCDNRRCCNPEHLFKGTRSENMQDCKRKGRLNTARKYDADFVERVREMLGQGISRREVSRRLGWPWGSLYRFEKRYGLRPC